MTALLVERPDVATIVVTGDDRLAWLQAVLTCDIATLRPGEGRWGLALNKPGKILAELWVLAAEDRCVLGVVGGSPDTLMDWLDSFIVMEDVELEDATAGHSWLAFHGEGASEAVAALVRAFPDFTGAEIDWSGKGGAAAVGPAERLTEFQRAACERGFQRATTEWEGFRIAHLLPKFGVDYDSSRNPHEASLERRAVSWSKGCYLGQEAVCMQDMRGKVKRRLVTVAFDAGCPPVGAALNDPESHEPIGTVTSCVQAEAGALAIASVKARFAEVGKQLVAGDLVARVVVVPPVT